MKTRPQLLGSMLTKPGPHWSGCPISVNGPCGRSAVATARHRPRDVSARAARSRLNWAATVNTKLAPKACAVRNRLPAFIEQPPKVFPESVADFKDTYSKIYTVAFASGDPIPSKYSAAEWFMLVAKDSLITTLP